MTKPDYLISTPENVDLHLELAGMGSRVWAAFLDQLIITMATIAVLLVCAVVAMALESSEIPRDTRSLVYFYMIGIAIFLVFLVQFGYYITFEGLWKGQTPGKRLVNIRVIDTTGQPVNWSAVWIRNLLRLVDQWLSMVGLLVMVIDKNERRLGDMAAGTLVIRERQSKIAASNLKIKAQAPPESGVDTGQMSPDEYHLLVNFLRRRHEMSGNSRKSMALELEEFLRLRLSTDFVSDSPEDFLEKVYLAYTARAELERS